MGQIEKIIAGLEPPAVEGLTRAPFPLFFTIALTSAILSFVSLISFSTVAIECKRVWVVIVNKDTKKEKFNKSVFDRFDYKRSRPRCLSTKVIKGELSITTDRRKTLVFFPKSQETCL